MAAAVGFDEGAGVVESTGESVGVAWTVDAGADDVGPDVQPLNNTPANKTADMR